MRMSDLAIRIEHLGKRYRYGGVAKLSDSFRADLIEWTRGLLRRGDRRPQTPDHARAPHETLQEIHERHLDGDPNYFWALKDINMEVRQGEVVGIIGRNGAGKSTLLKILSRITPPTTGQITYHGRIASLLEVGTGFHRELTGRENIFLNGSILGMKRAEIARKFDEIVAFAEVDKFIDTPVKFYSSGMYVRLAFAVAAHLEPEILVVDEVLAVGDAAFQRKCLGKMSAVAQQGRTVLFVSHNMAAITNLCTRCVLLKQGFVEIDGKPSDAIARYYDAISASQKGQMDLAKVAERCGRGEFSRLESIALLNDQGQASDTIPMGSPITIRLGLFFSRAVREPEVGVVISTMTGQRVVRFVSVWEGLCADVQAGHHQYDVRIPSLPLAPGGYTLTPWVKQRRGESDDLVEGALRFTVVIADVTGHAPYFDLYCQPGEFYQKSDWRMRKVDTLG
jgi:lipopolysaccharide transport system ATP-binding protein